MNVEKKKNVLHGLRILKKNKLGFGMVNVEQHERNKVCTVWYLEVWVEKKMKKKKEGNLCVFCAWKEKK